MRNPGSKSLRKGRYSQTNGIYLVTFVTFQRIPWFQDHELAQALSRDIYRPSFLGDAENLCFVVMPDHVHLLIKLGMTSLQKVMNRLKSKTAIRINAEIGRQGRFWDCGYHDHALRKEEDLLGAARYIVANPIRAGLVKKAGDYPYWNAKWL